jgi:type II restriction/modification system DNA methylase subunit YeeA
VGCSTVGGPFDSIDGDIGLLIAAASLDWSLIDPTIFGTLFERFLDPDKRAQIGAHYTDPDKIMMIIEPVILRPLHAEWAAARATIEVLLRDPEEALNALMATYIGVDELHDEIVEIQRSLSIRLQLELFPELQRARRKRSSDNTRVELRAARDRVVTARRAGEGVRQAFVERLRSISILDPACGSGNFLYLALQGVKDIELKANLECEALGLAPHIPVIGPEIVHGIEINPLAAELARTTIWIGDIQWRIRNGVHANPQPILRKLESIECRDAILNPDGTEAHWPDAEVVIGNPPFLGDKKISGRLDKDYVEALRETYSGRVGGNVDLVCYWFEKAASQFEKGRLTRVGLVATNSIRRGANRATLDRVTKVATIFEAWSDEKWVLDGAALRVSLICFGQSDGDTARLDGKPVPKIHSDLTGNTIDITKAVRLRDNRRASFLGVQKSGPLDVPAAVARDWLLLPKNPNGKSNSDILRPFWNGDDVSARPRDFWLIDFPRKLSEKDAALFQEPFEFLKSARYQPDDPEDLRTLEEARSQARDKHAREQWWEPYWPRPDMRSRIAKLSRYIVTPETPTYTLFAWLPSGVVPDKNLIVFARDDETFFGILHSRAHLLWVRALGSPYGNHPTARRYNNSRVFETFPFPDGLTPDIPPGNYKNDPHAQAIAKAAKRLDELRNAWLNPPDLVKIEPEVVPGYPDRILPKDAKAAVKLKTRTLTNLYNQRPQWLADAHRDLDAAVAAAYDWPADISEEDALAKLLELNLSRAGAVQEPEPIEEADEVD